MPHQIIKAAKSGDAAQVAAFLTADPTLVNEADVDGSTPLHYAAWKGHVEVTRVLLDAGADTAAQNANGHWGTTPLHAAAHANNNAIVQLLLERGADMNAKDGNGKTPLHHTTFHGAKAAARVLLAHGATDETSTAEG